MTNDFTSSPLFADLTDKEISACLACSAVKTETFKRDQLIFTPDTPPEKLMILLEGAVMIYTVSESGNRNVISTVRKSGELFGEIHLFLSTKSFDYFAEATLPSKVLTISKEIIDGSCAKGQSFQPKIIMNMLTILANEAYDMRQKMQTLCSGTLKQKIAAVFMQSSSKDGKVDITMNREEFADYLSVARPSLSRELNKMQKDGLIKINGRSIQILDYNELHNISLK